jgi:hypothetical protein
MLTAKIRHVRRIILLSLQIFIFNFIETTISSYFPRSRQTYEILER